MSGVPQVQFLDKAVGSLCSWSVVQNCCGSWNSHRCSSWAGGRCPCSCCSSTVMGVTAIMQRLWVSAGGASDSVIARVVGLQCAQRHGLPAGFGDEGVGAHHTGDELN